MKGEVFSRSDRQFVSPIIQGAKKDGTNKRRQPALKQTSISSFFTSTKKGRTLSNLEDKHIANKTPSPSAAIASRSISFPASSGYKTNVPPVDINAFRESGSLRALSSQGSFDEYNPDEEFDRLMNPTPIQNFKPTKPSTATHPREVTPKVWPNRETTPGLEADTTLYETSLDTSVKQGRPNVPSSSSAMFPNVTKRTSSFQELKLSTPKRIKLAGPRRDNSDNAIDANPRLSPLKNSKSADRINLTDEQDAIMDLVVNKRLNVFYTGSAGTGKSVILSNLVERLRNLYGRDAVALTASTGLAATSIGGVTLHKWAGIGIGTAPVGRLVGLLQKRRDQLTVWRNTKVLIIDEISMIDGSFLDKLEYVARAIRKNDKPFGGIQLVMTGDFFQLPPVQKRDSSSAVSTYCFESRMWRTCIQKTVLLTKVFRQQDNELIDILNSIRFGEIKPQMIRTIKNLEREIKYTDGIVPTELYATRREVERSNTRRLNSLPGEQRVFHSQDQCPRELLNLLDSSVMADRVLTLKEDAQVMMLKNRPDVELVNGSLGRILFFTTPRLLRKMTETYGVIDNDTIIDMRLASRVIANPIRANSKEFQQEVQARPVTRLSKLQQMISVAVGEHSKTPVYPFVRWSIGKNRTYHQLMEPEYFAVDIPGDKTGIERVQLPITLCWALSIHKAQGQTIQRLKVDLKNIFEAGQVYVALSRAVSMDNLQVLNFNAKKIQCNEKVKKFYEELEKVG